MNLPDLPYDLEAEAAVLGVVLYQPDTLTTIATALTPADFYLAKNAAIYRAMLECSGAGIPADVRIISARMREAGTLEGAGGLGYLMALMSDTILPSHAEHYAAIVEGHATRRRLISAGSKIAALGYATGRKVDEVLAEAAAELAGARLRSAEGLVPMSRVAEEMLEQHMGGAVRGVLTGLYDLDELIGGLCPGDLCIVAGRPGHGKSSLALTVADTLARGGRVVDYFTLEMRRDELAQRLIAMRSAVPASVQRRREYSDEEFEAVTRAISQIGSLPIHVYDKRGLTIDDLRARALRHKAEHQDLALIIVDYLTLVDVQVSRGMNFSQAVGKISKGLKILAGEAEVPVMALAQLNRQVDGRANNVPMLSDLKESGDIEADADQVIIAVRPEKYELKDEEQRKKLAGICELYLLKNRHGEEGMVTVLFDGPRTLLKNRETYRAMAGY